MYRTAVVTPEVPADTDKASDFIESISAAEPLLPVCQAILFVTRSTTDFCESMQLMRSAVDRHCAIIVCQVSAADSDMPLLAPAFAPDTADLLVSFSHAGDSCSMTPEALVSSDSWPSALHHVMRQLGLPDQLLDLVDPAFLKSMLPDKGGQGERHLRDLFSLSSASLDRLEICNRPETADSQATLNLLEVLQQWQSVPQRSPALSLPASVACHLARTNQSATQLVVDHADATLCLPLLQSLLASSPSSKLEFVQLCSTPLPVWPLRRSPSKDMPGTIESDKHGPRVLHLDGQKLTDIDSSFLSSMLQTKQAQASVKAYHVSGDSSSSNSSFRQIVTQLGALPNLVSAQGVPLQAMHPRKGDLCLHAHMNENSHGEKASSTFHAGGGAALAAIVRRHRTSISFGEEELPRVGSAKEPNDENDLGGVQAARTAGSVIRRVQLSMLPLGDTGSALVADALQEAVQGGTAQLCSLAIARTHPGDVGVQAWLRLLRSTSAGESLVAVDVSHNGMDDRQLQDLVEVLGKLPRAVLAHPLGPVSNRRCCQTAPFLAGRPMSAPAAGLQVLDVSGNCASMGACSALGSVGQHGFRALLQLNLSSNNIADAAGAKLAPLLLPSASCQVTSLDLSGNPSLAGVCGHKLGPVLASNTAICELRLARTHFGAFRACCQEYGEKLGSCGSHTLHLSRQPDMSAWLVMVHLRLQDVLCLLLQHPLWPAAAL